jgi:hypothetical protein
MIIGIPKTKNKAQYDMSMKQHEIRIEQVSSVSICLVFFTFSKLSTLAVSQPTVYATSFEIQNVEKLHPE